MKNLKHEVEELVKMNHLPYSDQRDIAVGVVIPSGQMRACWAHSHAVLFISLSYSKSFYDE